MPLYQQFITIGVAVLGTVLTRFLPYIVFPEGKKIPRVINYLGKVLAPAVFGLLVIYCLRNVNFAGAHHGLPELISIAVVIALFIWKKGMILPMAGGTVCYMLLVHFVF
ncbi:branched-chain amino acid transporter permease [Bilifractor sp. LCP19S3_H10]|uniref:branched-chain amino acid transporter permease n=1 Tax=Bilifractor sp. LCP19S3_H10 TaxID=3438736 RepID=UPI003F8F0DFE